jgi:hypothetical protein
MKGPGRYEFAALMQRWGLRRRAKDGWISHLPTMAAGWTQIRDMPSPATVPFHKLWRSRKSAPASPKGHRP